MQSRLEDHWFCRLDVVVDRLQWTNVVAVDGLWDDEDDDILPPDLALDIELR